MKKILFVILLTIPIITVSQIKHYLSYNTVAYTDFFNKEKDRSNFPNSFLIPNISYKIERKKMGLEINMNYNYGNNYYPIWSKELVPEYSILQINASSLSIAYHYRLVNSSFLIINPFLGIVRNWLEALTIEHWQFGGSFNGFRENKFGVLTGINLNVPIYKGDYLNINPKYYRFPTAVNQKQIFIFEFGLGYMLQGKKK